MIVDMLMLLFLLLCGHALADFAWQNDFVAKNKNRKVGGEMWFHCLTAHSLHHGLATTIAIAVWSGDLKLAILFGVAETIIHWWIDFWKCKGVIGVHFDQFLHVFWKIIWVLIYYVPKEIPHA